MRKFTRRSRTRVAAAAVAAIAVLSLSACQGDEEDLGGTAPQSPSEIAPADPGTDTDTEEEAPGTDTDDGTDTDLGSDTDTDTGADTGTDTDAGTDTDTGSDTDAGTDPGTDTDTDDGVEAPACDTSMTEVVAQSVSRPINHLLLTATNTGTEACYAYYAPYLRFDEGQSAVAWIEESVPHAVPFLEPGESVYASVVLSGESGEGETMHSLAVGFASGDEEGGSVGEMASVALPGGEAFVGPEAAVSYWLTDPADALMW
ncbi:DUF4232 domain-containing protein [Streptomyces sp. RFCAC02]|uniref:DUF4232 domain-containing protein n=1 Tax=Streptomyces sp. RFCAC02 TaxID=2499143 RepID=UPI00143D2627|nr:DUF4232 domain-containing protein [Streptomyces sp. RFCAC02]